MATKSHSPLVITVIVGLLALGIGLVIGYLLRPFKDPCAAHTNGNRLWGIEAVDGDKLAALDMLKDCSHLARDNAVINK